MPRWMAGTIRFRHALFHEAAYDLLTEQDRVWTSLGRQYLQAQGTRSRAAGRTLSTRRKPARGQSALSGGGKSAPWDRATWGGTRLRPAGGLDCDVAHELPGCPARR